MEKDSLGGIAVSFYQIGHHADSLAGGFGALKGDVDKRTVVDKAGSCKFVAAAPCALGNHKTVFVHVAYGGVCMSHFGNFTERFSGIPFHHFAQGSLFVVGCGLVVKLPV